MSEPTDNKIIDDVPADLYPEERFKELIEAGVFYGRKKTKTQPRMKPFILTTRNDMEIIDLNKTLEGLEKAIVFLKENAENNKTVFLVGTQPQAVEEIVSRAKELNLPFVTVRWLGGLLTNFKVLSKRVEYYKKLKTELKSGVLEKYTKKERLGFERELRRLEELFGGLENYTALPDALLIIDPPMHLTAVREAKHLNIPIVAYANTDSDPELIDYPVVGNTKARKSINWFLREIAEALKEAKVAERPAAIVQEAAVES